MSETHRIEKDSLGEVRVASSAMPGAQTQRPIVAKAAQVGHHVKPGHTHLMHALPITLGQER